MDLEAFTRATAFVYQATNTPETSACIPIWVAGAIITPLAGAVVYQTRRIVQLTDLAIELAKRQERHDEQEHVHAS